MRDRAHDRYSKVLLLGTSESGKSTLLKSIKLFLEGPYSLGELESFKELIFSNMLWSMRVILDEMEKSGMYFEDQKNEYYVQTIDMAPNHMEIESLESNITDAIRELWKDGGVLECFKRSKEYQLNDSAE